jgi:hypothetical protein
MTATKTSRSTGVKVLVASARTQEHAPVRRFECLEGELCWVLPSCGNEPRGCSCWSEFEGASTQGRTTTVRVSLLRDMDRRAVLTVLRASATSLVGPVLGARAAERSLEIAERVPLGTFLIRGSDGVRSQFCEHHQQLFATGGPSSEEAAR